ncbi:MAG: HPr family phosphocarrier protein [bacterium]
MIEKSAIIQNAAGIHCRPSAVIVTAAIAYSGVVRVSCDEGSADARSLLALVSLGLSAGTTVRIRVSGPDEEAFCKHLVALFERHFDFAERIEDDI